MSSFATLRVVPFVALLATGCADTAKEETARAESNLTESIALSIDDCEDPFVVHSIALGGSASIVAPKDWRVVEALSLDAADAPALVSSLGGDTKFTWNLSRSEPERFLRTGRFLLQKNDGSSSAQCAFHVSDARWTRLDAGDWLPGFRATLEQEKDLGVLPVGDGGIVLAGVLTADPEFGARFETVAGSPPPSRVTQIGREGQWVYEASEPGKYKVDVVSFSRAYGEMRTHVSFEFRR